MLIRIVALPLLAIGGLGVAYRAVGVTNATSRPTPAFASPPVAPFEDRVSATGMVEASSRNVAIGVPVPGVVAEVGVEVGARVERGALLFRIDDREVAAQLAVRQAELTAAEAELARLRAMPRTEELLPLRATLAQREADSAEAARMWATAEALQDTRAMSGEDRARRQLRAEAARAGAAEAKARVDLLAAGAWAPDLAVAEAKVAAARASALAAQTEIDRRRVLAPIAGRVLQVNLRAGEYAAAGPVEAPVLVLGAVDPLHVRCDVDEMDVWRVREGAPARAFVRGNAALSAPLTFVLIEPLMVPKRALSGSSRERVDTRVLQVVYALDPQALPVQVGQLVDVYIEARPAAPERK